MLLYQNALTVILIFVLVNTLNNMRRLRRPLPPEKWSDPPLVSVMVPARNEERNIGRCVRSLLAQDYPRLEVLVLDDHSVDRTPAILEELAREDERVTVLDGQPLPPNWHGKAYACYQLARAARGEWLLFVDADTQHDPRCVSSTVWMAIQERADLLSLFPHFATGTWWERLMLPVIPFALLAGLPLAFVHRRQHDAIATASLARFCQETRKELGHVAIGCPKEHAELSEQGQLHRQPIAEAIKSRTETEPAYRFGRPLPGQPIAQRERGVAQPQLDRQPASQKVQRPSKVALLHQRERAAFLQPFLQH